MNLGSYHIMLLARLRVTQMSWNFVRTLFTVFRIDCACRKKQKPALYWSKNTDKNQDFVDLGHSESRQDWIALNALNICMNSFRRSTPFVWTPFVVFHVNMISQETISHPKYRESKFQDYLTLEECICTTDFKPRSFRKVVKTWDSSLLRKHKFSA